MTVLCSKCGSDDVISYADRYTAICPVCCEKDGHDGFGVGHEFEQCPAGAGRVETLCKFCGIGPSPDWYADEAEARG